MNIENRMIFVVQILGILVLIISSYNTTFQTALIHASADEDNDNKTKIKTDVKEQEDKCKKKAECKSTGTLNNELTITNITQVQTVPPATLNVTNTLVCLHNGIGPQYCEGIGPENTQITVIGNHPNPSEFPGSSNGTLVTLEDGEYIISEIISIPPEIPFGFSIGATFSGNCTSFNSGLEGKGTITIGESQKCNIENTITFRH